VGCDTVYPDLTQAPSAGRNGGHGGGPSAARPSWSAVQQPAPGAANLVAERRQRCRAGPTEPSRMTARKVYQAEMG